MIEEWKVIKEYKTTSTHHIKGDKVYVSNLGRVKLNDIILEYGKGLFVNKDGNICIYVCGYPYKTLYRTIYYLFKYDDRLNKGNKYQIHHKDFNHLNNRLDNLELLSNEEHVHKHKREAINLLSRYNEEIQFLYDKRNLFKEQSSKFLKDRVNEYKKKIKEERKNDLNLLKEKRIQQEKEERENKLKSGLYNLNSKGHLQYILATEKLKTSRKGIKASVETKLKQSNSLKQKYVDDSDYRNRVSKGVKKYFTNLNK